MSAKTRPARKPAPPQLTPEELMAMAETPPAPRAPPTGRPPLLRYIPGKSPIYLGVSHAER
jgi:hypothetical protein